MVLITLLLLLLAGCILFHSQISLQYALTGLDLWFRKMIPSLLPFMILSGVMIRMKLTEKVALVLYPLAGPLYRIRKNVCYCMLLGFLCGFPMGAKVTADLYRQGMITHREAEYLLAFTNNIGPVYFCSFVLPLLGRRLVLPYLFGMYGIPLLYGLVLRYTAFRDLTRQEEGQLPGDTAPLHTTSRTLPFWKGVRKESSPSADLHAASREGPAPIPQKGMRFSLETLLEQLDDTIFSSIRSILMLGGYMVLFNLINLVPHVLLGKPVPVLAPLLEITGGLAMLQDALPLYSLLVLSFGGLSCIAQTYSCIKGTGLSLPSYVFHKCVLTVLAAAYYLCWFFSSPKSFLC